jgi:glucosamine-phosphate N-acetyltransferase
MRENIEYCKEQDFNDIFKLLKQLWPKLDLDKDKIHSLYSKAINSTNQIYICYKYKGEKAVGFCSMVLKNNLWQQGKVAHLEELIVDENYRRKGIGKKLITEIVLIARFKGCKRIELDSAFTRKKAHVFYEDLGFKNRAYLFSKVL